MTSQNIIPVKFNRLTARINARLVTNACKYFAMDYIQVTQSLCIAQRYDFPSTLNKPEFRRTIHKSKELWMSLDKLILPIIVVPHDPNKIGAFGDASLNGLQYLHIESLGVTLVAAGGLVQWFPSVVMADFSIVELVAAKHESRWLQVLNKRHHRAECGLVILRKVQIVTCYPNLWLCHIPFMAAQ